MEKLFGIIDLDWRFELTRFKAVRRLLKSRWFPLLLLLVNLFVFVVILVSGLVGGFSSGNYNFGIMIVWILWWVLLMLLLVPGFSRSWCMMCPFPIFSDWFQRRRLYEVRQDTPRGMGLRWPKALKNMWLLNVLFLATTFFSGFFNVKPLATFFVLGGIILIAFVVGLLFPKRTFCLYLCPVSGFIGLYSQFGATEIRRKDPEICRKHKPKTCYVGNAKGHGCPWFLTPFDFKKNTYCGMCMECFKSCPYDNMALNLRPPGVDLLVDTRREPKGLDEAWKAFIMLGIAMMFFLTFQGPWGFIKDMVRAKTAVGYLQFISFHTVFNLLIIPAIFLLFALLSKLASSNREASLKRVFTHFAYTLIPLGLGVWIAFSIGIILPNWSYILHILSDPFAWGWNLFGTANFPWTPVATGAMGYAQGTVLALFYLFSVEYGYKLSRQLYGDSGQAKRGWIPIFLFLTSTTLVFLWLFLY
jgi:polyferredoxin